MFLSLKLFRMIFVCNQVTYILLRCPIISLLIFCLKCYRISIGENHCIYFQKNGRITSRGNNFNGQLGTTTRSSKNEHFQHTITRHSSDDFVQQVVALDSATFILNSIGDLISFGKNKHGMYCPIICL